MAEETVNYKLIKPGLDDAYDIAEFNRNMDILDAIIRKLEEKSDTLGRVLIGGETTELNPNDTLFLVEGWIDPALFTSARMTNVQLDVQGEPGAYIIEEGEAFVKTEAGGHLTGSVAMEEEDSTGAAFLYKNESTK